MWCARSAYFILLANNLMPEMLRWRVSLSPLERSGLREPLRSEKMFTSTKVVFMQFIAHIFKIMIITSYFGI